jgi:hypothetical protein
VKLPSSKPLRVPHPGPLRSRAGRGGWLLLVAAAVGLVVALATTGRLLDRSIPSAAAPARPGGAAGVAPVRVGGKAECPPASPVLAATDHRSYPPGHPARPGATATVAGCYRTAGEAAAAGYAPAPLPSGALQAGGAYLARTGPGFQANCRRAAGRLGFAVPCPWLLPTSPAGTTPSSLCQPASCARPRPMPPLRVLSFAQDGFAVRPGSTGAPWSYGALSILAVPARDADGGQAFGCPGGRRVATPALHGRPAVLLACPAGSQGWSSDSVALSWSQGGSLVVVGLRGDSERSRRLAVAVAGGFRLVRP